jgi:hypothetical protein
MRNTSKNEVKALLKLMGKTSFFESRAEIDAGH